MSPALRRLAPFQPFVQSLESRITPATYTVNDPGDAGLADPALGLGPAKTSDGKITLESSLGQIERDTGGGTVRFDRDMVINDSFVQVGNNVTVQGRTKNGQPSVIIMGEVITGNDSSIHDVKIDAAGRTLVTNGLSMAKNFSATNVIVTNSIGHGFLGSSSEITLTNCTAENNGKSGIFMIIDGCEVIDCTSRNNAETGITVESFSTVRGCEVVNNGQTGVVMESDSKATDNFVGVAKDGNTVGRNRGGGISFENDCIVTGNTVTAISGLSGNTIADNSVGVGKNGTTSLSNPASGISIFGDGNTIRNNIVGRNGSSGVNLEGNDNELYRNRIGIGPADQQVPNAFNGVQITGDKTTVGGSLGDKNTIAFNGGFGVLVAGGTGNTIRFNSIYANDKRAIDLIGVVNGKVDTFTLNDPSTYIGPIVVGTDIDSGANGLQNYPFFLRTEADGRRIWQLNGMPGARYDVDFYSNTEPHKSGFGDAEIHLVTERVVLDPQGHKLITAPRLYQFTSATATNAETGDTSEVSMVDTDGDGLADAWETEGIDADEDGDIDLTLPGAGPRKKDVFVEVDVLAGIPNPSMALAMVERAYAKAPAASVRNPDGSEGIRLHANVNESGLADPSPAAPWGPNVFTSAGPFSVLKGRFFGASAAQRADPAAMLARKLVYRYCIFANGFQPFGPRRGFVSGASQGAPGDDFFVSLFGFAGDVTKNQAGTFMHELGHCLGLQHGGGGTAPNGAGDEAQFKPNLYSVMNYLWQLPYNSTSLPLLPDEQVYVDGWRLDYSRSALPTLNEAALLEGVGIGGDANVRFELRNGSGQFVPLGGPVDWGNDGVAGSPATAVSRNTNLAPALELFAGREDWSQLSFYFAESPAFGDSNDPDGFEDEITNDQHPGQDGTSPPPPPPVPPVSPPPGPPVSPPPGPPVSPPPPPGLPPISPPTPIPSGFAVGGPSGVSVRGPDGTERFAFEPFPGLTGGVRTASADFNGDGVLDIVAGTGPGVPTKVVIIDGSTQEELFTIDPFEAAFLGGVFVAAGDLNGDGFPELVITPDRGGGPRCRIFSGDGFVQLADFFGIDDPNFRGGARAAVADVSGDGTGDLLVAAGFGGGPRLAVFDGKSLASVPEKPFGDFFVFEQTLRNGVFIAGGDLDGDGNAEVIAGGGPGGGPRVFALSGKALMASAGSDQQVVVNFFAGDTASRAGVRVATANLDDDARADLVVGLESRAVGYVGTAITPEDAPEEAVNIEAFSDTLSGVFVG